MKTTACVKISGAGKGKTDETKHAQALANHSTQNPPQANRFRCMAWLVFPACLLACLLACSPASLPVYLPCLPALPAWPARPVHSLLVFCPSSFYACQRPLQGRREFCTTLHDHAPRAPCSTLHAPCAVHGTKEQLGLPLTSKELHRSRPPSFPLNHRTTAPPYPPHPPHNRTTAQPHLHLLTLPTTTYFFPPSPPTLHPTIIILDPSRDLLCWSVCVNCFLSISRSLVSFRIAGVFDFTCFPIRSRVFLTLVNLVNS